MQPVGFFDWYSEANVLHELPVFKIGRSFCFQVPGEGWYFSAARNLYHPYGPWPTKEEMDFERKEYEAWRRREDEACRRGR